ncbi:MAG: CHAT domain-containing protein, partial [Cyanobacteria bacterium J06632_3]
FDQAAAAVRFSVPDVDSALSRRRGDSLIYSPLLTAQSSSEMPLEISLDSEEAAAMISEGFELINEGVFDLAIARFQSALSLISADDLDLKGRALLGRGEAYLYSGQYEAARQSLEEAIALYANTDNLTAINIAESEYANLLIDLSGRLGIAYRGLAHFGTSLDYFNQALSGEGLLYPPTRAALLASVGGLEAEIGQYERAETTLKEAVELSKELESWEAAASAIAALGWVYERQGKFAAAIEQYEDAIALFQQNDDLSQEIRIVNNIGIVYLKQGDTAAARMSLERALALLDIEDDPVERAILLDSLGSLQLAEGNASKAWSTYLRSLKLSRQSEDKVGEIEVLLNLGALMRAQSEPDLAIFFYKQAIAEIETIRQDLQRLSQSVQQRYTQTVEDFYRTLADLLLQQDRVTEASQILDLLKLQEVKAYFNSDLEEHASSDISSSDTIAQLNTAAETDLADALERLSADISLAEFIDLPESAALSAPIAESSAEPLNQSTIEQFQTLLAQQPVKSAALYPLVLDDRLEIVLITPEEDPIHHAESITQAELSALVGDLQRKLSSPVLDPQAEAQQLYDRVIRPIEAILLEQEIENIIYLPDDVLRYIPLAVLHDGQDWLAQRFQSHNITAAEIGSLTQQSATEMAVLAGAFTDESPAHTVQVGRSRFTYDGLPAAGQEIDRLKSVMPNTTALVNGAFSPDNLLSAVGNQRIVHLATHAKFLPGQPESSFILFGDGSVVTLRDVGEWSLPGVDLVVFSACQTATSVEGDGKEILGLGYQVQQTGAKSAIASLWAVDDDATAALMNQFYIALSEGKTKAAAIQQAQQQLINSDGFSHPYRWAAFILIGNGL